ncbi:hypothetical protein FNV43_RR10902 [Rhamnella rubrinervis]|uniref:Mediator of RNA polymerase II transcription subunit 1 n=1 Tax=Rhamnella rubrinervis TaxID=2594499 RepID=A0A8K0H4K2_9ROSA|nr:hypothetical protein FNV43_RR10902 [Rhamnella rubrinervis]
MERSEPTLVPQWLRSTGSVTGGGNSAHHFASSSSQSEVTSLSNNTRNRNSKGISDFDTPRSAFLDRSSSSNSRRSSTNGSAKHAYSSFNRSHREKDREKDKDRSSFGDHWERDSSDPLGTIFSRGEKDTLRRSQSMVSRKQGEILPKRISNDLKNSSNTNHANGNGMLSGVGIGSSIQKAVFEKDFPSLGTEGVPDIGRVSSSGFTTAVQSLPVGSSALIGGEGWTSALVEVPVMGSSSTGSFSAQQTVTSTSGSGATSTMAGLNMAETLAQAPSRARTAPQLSVKTQRLEELAIKQSRQLIPVTPSLPKALVPSSSDKSKPKAATRAGETNVTTKSGHQPQTALHNPSQSLRGGSVKSSDTPKSSHGKFLVLKPVWENGVSPTSRDVTSPTNKASSSRAANTQLAVAPPVVSAPLRSPNSQKLSSVERKVAALDLKSGSTLEKRPSLSQVQSRNDFFNLIKKKTSRTSSNVLPDSGTDISSPTMEKSGEVTREVHSAPTSPHPVENGAEVIGNCSSCGDVQRFSDVEEKNICSSEAVYPDEEEAAFLRSLGWEENGGGGEDEGLTEEEINQFYAEYMKLRPSLKHCRGMQPRLSMLSECNATMNVGGVSELSSSESGSDV